MGFGVVRVDVTRCMSERGFSITTDTQLMTVNQALLLLPWLPAAYTMIYSTEVDAKLLTGTTLDMFTESS